MSTGIIAGVVKGIARGPFGNACITATGSAGSSRTVITQSDGRYRIGGLRPGGYRLRIEACPSEGNGSGPTAIGYAWPGLPPLVSVLAGQVRTLPAATAWQAAEFGPANGRSQALPASAANRTGSISGRVTGHGHPLRDICAFAIRAFSGSNQPPARATTSSKGTYVIHGLRPGRYFVLFRTGEPSCPSEANWLPQWYPFVNSLDATNKVAIVRVRAGKDIPHVDGRLELGGEIAGIVRTTGGKPVKGICVNFYTGVFANGVYDATVASVSNRAGHYALRGLFPGGYQVQFMIGCGSKGNYAAQWWRDQPSPLHARLIKVTGTRVVAGIDATLVPGAAITGIVRAKTAAAKPLRGVCVSAADDQGDYADARTAKNGSYRIEGLDTGSYQATFDPTCSGFVSANYLPAQRTVFARDGETRAGVDAYLRPAAGISGVVRDSAGKPVGSVCVNIADQNNDFADTNPDGTYSISGVVPGRYSVNFETDCGSPGSLAPQWYDNQPDSDSADAVTFTGGKISRNIDVTLHPGGTLAGVLTLPDGQPVKGGDCIGLAAQHDSFSAGSFTGGGFTIHNGKYQLPDLSPGEYQVSFDCEDGLYADQWFNAQPDSTTADYLAINPGVTTRLNQKLSRAGSIAGTVANKAGHPISSLCVSVANARNGQILNPINGGPETDNHGRYLVGQLAPGHYLVQFSDCNNGVYGTQWYHGKYDETFAVPVIVRAGKTTPRINAKLTIGGTISGEVTGPAGKPANGTCVEAYDAASQSFGFSSTNRSGHYAIGGLGNGRYSVSFSDCYKGAPNLASVTLPVPVRVVAPHVVRGVNIALAAGGSITGTVAGQSDPPGPQTQACVLAMPTNPDGSRPLVFTDASGNYVMSGLAAGTYQVDLGDPNCDLYDFGVPDLTAQWYDQQPGQQTATLVTVSAGQTTKAISATLQPFGGIAGRVTDQADAGVAGECVTAVPFHAAADPVSGLGPAPDVAITLPSGRYRLLDLSPGQYQIEFRTGCGDTGFAVQWWQNAASSGSAKVITVGYKTIGGIDATLRR
jgi:hypothetical protein